MHQKDVISTPEAIQSDEHKHVVVLDTDIGDDIDDALALALALHSPEIDLRGITTVFGDTQKRAQLAQHMLHVFQREDIPIAIGVGKPLQQRHPPSGVAQAEILGNKSFERETFSTFSGPELIVQQALEHSGKLTLVCIGPLTNVAFALLIEPRIATAIKSIVMMGGSSGMPLPEWNVRSDVKAAHMILSSGIPVTMIGLNVTTRCQLCKQDIEQLRASTATQAKLLYQLITIWQQYHPRFHPRLPFLHDPLTVVTVCMPELLQFRDMNVHIVERGPFEGFMMPHILGDLPVHAAVGVQASKTRNWIMQRLLTA
ncbi:MAG: pyrimidine-specific ribonucleoside hydrolase RihA [Ktedonobacteraceae bacterium]